MKIKDKKTLIFVVFLALFGLTVAFVLSVLLVTKQNAVQEVIEQLSQREQYHRSLDGLGVNFDKTDLKPIVVLIENHQEARPVSGLDQASIVYEVIIEGDITRFLAIFDFDFTAKKIGPVRSVRPFFVDLVEEWDPILFHAGGSTEGLAAIKQSPVYNVNEISADGIYFWRDVDRDPPHNLYTSANLIKRAIAAKEISTSTDFLVWQFKDDQPLSDSSTTIIPIDFSKNEIYRPVWRYNFVGNDYTRYVSDQVDKTDQGVFLKTKNIVVQYVNYDIIDDYGRLEIDVESGGDAVVYQDGTRIEAIWEKIGVKTRFFDLGGDEIKFNRGKVWVELVFNKQ